jgi:ribosomal protein RSM22 (predicted rRNA methylase)
LAKRAIIGTKTIIDHDHTIVKVIDAVDTTVDTTTTVARTRTVTETDASFVGKLFVKFYIAYLFFNLIML